MPIGIDLGSRYVKIIQTSDFRNYKKIRMDTVRFLTEQIKRRTKKSCHFPALADMGFVWKKNGLLPGTESTCWGKKLKPSPRYGPIFGSLFSDRFDRFYPGGIGRTGQQGPLGPGQEGHGFSDQWTNARPEPDAIWKIWPGC